MADLLIELFSEEIPARMQGKASDDLKRMITGGLKEAGLTFESAAAFATPRRLALSLTGVPTATPDISEERRGPRADAPEKALEGFMRGAGVTRDQLEEREEKKGTFFYAKIEKPGRAAADVIAEAITDTVRNFPWPKSQRWGQESIKMGSLKWVRPLHSVLCVFDGKPIEFEIDGVKAGNSTSGHRFMAPGAFTVVDFADYKTKLLEHKVMLDPVRRETLIYDTAQTLVAAAGLELVEDKGLLAEVAGLVEWPVPMIGSFDAGFLEVPEEVLQLTMKKDQKYFVTRDPATGKLANKFIFTANIEPSDDGSAVTDGNQRVLAARLADAKFFYTQDLKHKLDENLPQLADIVFHEKLGTVAERVERIKKLSRYLADFIPGCDANEAERAAELAKADLVSGMVGEFASLQGVMGRYYAIEQCESAAVADAIRDHYAPAGPNDACPTTPVSVAVALAEKLDTLVGFFGIDQKPTGSKDPYALRRAAFGMIRLVTENKLKLPLRDAIHETIGVIYHSLLHRLRPLAAVASALEDVGVVNFDDEKLKQMFGSPEQLSQLFSQGELATSLIETFGFKELVNLVGLEKKELDASLPEPVKAFLIFSKNAQNVYDELPLFFGDRLKAQQRDKGVRHDLIDAVFAKGDDDLVRILNRVSALSNFLDTDDGINLLAGYKRAVNIVRIEEKKSDRSFATEVNEDLLVQAEEKTLYDALWAASNNVQPLLKAENFEGVMRELAGLRAPINAFFDEVTVNVAGDVENHELLRENRLALLSLMRAAVNTVADFSLIEG